MKFKQNLKFDDEISTIKLPNKYEHISHIRLWLNSKLGVRLGKQMEDHLRTQILIAFINVMQKQKFVNVPVKKSALSPVN